MRTELGYEVRAYDDADEPRVLELLAESLGAGPAGARPAAFFRWKHLANPFGRSFMLVADAEGELIGFRSFMRWTFRAGDRSYRAVRAVDTATHPAFQGKGVFSALTMRAIEALADEADFIFNTPNAKSLPGYLKMGWHVVDRLPVHVAPGRPLRLVRHALTTQATPLPDPGAPPVGEILATSADDVSSWIDAGDIRLTTKRSSDYVRWRYVDAPLLDYRAVSIGSGLAIFRVRHRGRFVEATVAELLAGDPAGARRLLRAVRRCAGTDHLAIHAASGTGAHAALRRCGFLRAPRGLTFVARPLRPGLDPDPTRPESWALSTGDLEVF